MGMPEYASAVIVGAGPTGLTAGNLLGMAGIDTIILERNVGLSDCPKAIAFDDEGLRICQAMGLSDAVLKDVLLDLNAHYVSAGRLFSKVEPTSKRNGYPVISTFHQPTFEAALLEGLQRFKCVNIHFQHTVEAFEQTDSSVIVSVRAPDGELLKIECTYLLACDGGKSSIRHALGIPMQGSTFAQKWLVIDSIRSFQPAAQSAVVPVSQSNIILSDSEGSERLAKGPLQAVDQSSPADQNTVPIVTFFCNPKRPAVSIPAPHQGRRWEFMLLPGEQEEDLLREEKIQALISEVGGPTHPQIIRKAIYTFHAALAQSFSRGRIFLLGDAAHMMPPFGGQAMNSGLRDAHNLCWKLQLVLQGRASPQLLETYHQERHKHVVQMIRFSSFLGSVVMTKSPLVALFRDSFFRTLNRIPPTRKFLSEVGLKPQPRYKKGFLLSNGSRSNRVMAGFMLPQPEVTTSQGKRLLLDNLVGTGFAVLRLHHDPTQAFAPLIPYADIWKRLGTQFICIQPETEHSSALSPLVLQSNELAKFLYNRHDIFVLVRPDRYIYGIFKEENAEAFISSLRRDLLLTPHP